MRLFILPLLPMLASFAAPATVGPPLAPATISFTPVPLDESAPARRRLGALLYVGGWELRSDDPRFGGLSALHVEGREATAVSDAGALVRFTLPGGGAPRLAIAPLPDGPGRTAAKADRDSEAMAIDGERAWISFERANAIWRYDRRSWRSDSHAAPPAMQDWPSNAGGEAMLRLPDGRFLILSEAGDGPDGSTAALLFDGDPAVPGTPVTRLGYRAPEGYRVTDAALLPDGRILYLNRRFTVLDGVSAKLTLGSLPELHEDAILTGREIAHLRPPLTVDNMEGLSVTQERGRTMFWLVSDDNFSPLQRTLLMKFALAD
jgi:hypothetical protein